MQSSPSTRLFTIDCVHKVVGMTEETHLELFSLDEVITLEDGDGHRPGATVDAHGTIRITSSRCNNAGLTILEGLRRRLRSWNLLFLSCH